MAKVSVTKYVRELRAGDLVRLDGDTVEVATTIHATGFQSHIWFSNGQVRAIPANACVRVELASIGVTL
jgi:hypothetical protein